LKTLEKVLLVLIIILLAAGIYVALRNIDFFNVGEIDVSVSGPVTSVSTDMQRIINPLKGRNIFEINLRSLKKTLLAFDGVREVRIRRYYPSKLIIEIDYNDMTLKAFTLSEESEVVYYFIHDDVLEEVKQTTWDAFDKLATVELNPAYAQMVMKWGSDQGFKSMVSLAEHLANNNLITSMKYDNNNGNEFGRLVIGISSLNSTLFVRELVSVQRLDEALEIISSQFSAGGETVVYDLYANTLVKRT
jgi:hypothetical protein